MDISLFFLVNHGMVNPLFDVLMPLLSQRGFLLVFPVLALALIALLQKREAFVNPALIAATVVIVPVGLFYLADNINDLLKEHFARERPCFVLEGVRVLVRCPTSYSLPSGHAIDSFSFAVSFFILSRGILSRGWRWYALVLAGTIAFSRVYIGVHYPADVLVGTLLGTGLAGAVSIPFLRLYPPPPDRQQKRVP